MATLTGTKIKDTYDGLLKVADNVAITSTKQLIQDGTGNNSSLYISSEDFQISTFLYVDINSSSPVNSKVGFGISSPLQTIHIDNDSDPFIRISTSTFTGFDIGQTTSTGNAQIRLRDNTSMVFQTNNSEKMRLTNLGRLGIGTTTPTVELEVVGDIKVGDDKKFFLGDSSHMQIYFDGTAEESRVDSVAKDLNIRVNAGVGAGKSIFMSKSSAGPSFELKSTGQIKFNDYGSGTFTGTSTYKLAVDTDGNIIELPIGSGAVDGSGTANTITMWSDADTLTNAPITISSNDATFAGNITMPDYIVHTGDGDTKIGFNIDDTVEIRCGGNLQINADASRSYLRFQGTAKLYTDTLGVIIPDKLGIGTTSPGVPLDVVGIIRTTTSFVGDNSIVNKITAATSSGDIKFRNNSGTDKAIITDAGNLGIGITSPEEKLTIKSGNIQFRQNASTADTSIGFIGFKNTYATGTHIAAKIDVLTRETGSSVHDYTNISFQTWSGYNSLAEKFRINDSGKIKMNIYGSGTFTGTATYKLAVDSSGNIIEIPIGSGAVDGSGSANTVTMWSDADTLTDAPITISSNDATFAGDITVDGGDINTSNIQTLIGGGSFRIKNNGGTTIATFADNKNTTFEGNVGINTTSPGHLLEVRGTADALSVGDDSNTQTYMRFANSRTMVGYTGSDAAIQSGSGKGIRFNVNDDSFNSGTVMHITSDGNVGIGTTSPQQKLHVSGTIRISGTNNFDIFSDTTAGTFDLNSSTRGFLFKNSNGDLVTIDSGGQVGIGTTSPSHLVSIGTIGNASGKKLTFYLGGVNGDYAGIGAQRGESNVYCSSEIRFINEDNSSGKGAMSFNTGLNTLNERMRITSDGNIGIGTTSPGTSLDIQGVAAQSLRVKSDSSATIIIDSDGDDDGTAGSYLHYRDTGATKWTLYKETNNDFYLHNAAAGTYPIHAKAGGHIVLMEDGNNLGVGVSSPGAPLDVKSNSTSSADSGIRLIANGSSDVIAAIGEKSTNGGRFHLYDGGVLKVSLYGDGTANYIAAGNTGIGTTNPSEKLEVEGNILVTSDSSTNLKIQAKNSSSFNDPVLEFVTWNVASGASSGKIQLTNGAFNNNDMAFFTETSNSVTEKMRITSTGNVGIGTTSPGGKLQLDEYTVGSNGSQNIFGNLSSFSNSGSENLFLGIKDASYPNRGWAFNPVSNGVNSDLVIKEHGSTGERMRIETGGKVGIGTTAPGARLHVHSGTLNTTALFQSSDDKAFIIIRDDDTDSYLISKDSAFYIGANSSDVTTFKVDLSSGNVGIGTDSPSNKLDVNGNIAVNQTAGGNSGIKIITKNDAEAFLIMGDPDDNSMGGIAYNNNTNTLSFDCNNAERMTINQNGYVGINTTNPSRHLHVLAPANAHTGIKVVNENTNSGAASSIILESNSGKVELLATEENYSTVSGWADSGVLSSDSTASGGLKLNAGANSLYLQTGATTAVTIDNSQNATFAGFVDAINFKINGAQGSDGQVLTSTGAGVAWENVSGGGGTIDGSGAANKLAIWSDADTLTSDTNLHWDTSNDRLGIGDTSPSEALTVSGNIAVTGTVDGVDIAARNDILTLTSITATGALPKSGGTMTGDLILSDNVRLEIGSATGGDLRIYHNTANSIIEDSGTGDLVIKFSNDLLIEGQDGENLINCNEGSSVQLYHNGSEKIRTDSTGVVINGNIDMESSSGDLLFSADTAIQVDGDSGSNGQVLTSTGSALTWTTPSSGSSGFDYIHTSIFYASSNTSTSFYQMPFMGSSQESTSIFQFHAIVVPYNGYVKRVEMKNVAQQVPTSTSTEIDIAKDTGTGNSPSLTSIYNTGSLSHSAAVRFQISSNLSATDATFSAGDILYIRYKTNGLLRRIVFNAVFHYTP